MAQRINEEIGILSAVEAECHFVQVGLQMLSTEFMPCSHDAPLEQRKCRFDGVGVNVGSEADVLLRGVVDGFMLMVTNGSRVCGEIIRDDYIYVLGDILFDVALQS